MVNESFGASAMAMGAKAMNTSMLESGMPPLPAYSARTVEDLLPFVSDMWLSMVLPVVVYWIVSIFFHLIDVYDVWPEYRLHTPEEISSRNRVSRYEVARDVLVQQVIQMITGGLLSISDPPQVTGMQDFDVAVWARRVRLAQRALPLLINGLGLNAASISANLATSHPLIAGALAGGYYPFLTTGIAGSDAVVPTFATWEMLVAKFIYYFAIPGAQLLAAIVFLDAWQYALHRLMHVNKFMYTHFHSRHHRLYVPYAYGALYNHPFEGFLLDTLGAGLAYKLTGMTCRQGMWFFCICTVKTVDDHCGYALPWDPAQHISSNNAAYHDIHHQTWGIKTNFSQPFFTFWDRKLGTMYMGDRGKIEHKKAAEINKARAKLRAKEKDL